MKKKPTRKKTNKTWRRSAAVPLQVFLTEETNTKLAADLAATNRSKSEHLRLLIETYKPPKPRRKRARKPPTAAEPADPRQTNIEELTARPEGEALREWAEREGRSDWLQENLS